MKTLSVIVPVYKVEPYIHKCVDSILNQTYTNLEVILVDDGSPDNCGKICDEYAEKDSRVKVIHKKNGGLADARNFGIEAATGEIIGFVDSDDYIEPYMYQQMIDYMEQNSLDIVCADTKQVKENKIKFKPRYTKNQIWNKKEAICENLNGNLDNAVWNKIYKREVIGSVRFPKGRVYEDVATIYKFFYNADKVGYLAKGYYYYIKRKGSTISTSFNSKSRYDCFVGYIERLEFAEKHKLPCIEACRKQALETALATLTAFYANNENRYSDRYKNVNDFIKMQLDKKNHLRKKHEFLLWSFKNFKAVHEIYAKLSSAFKRM